MSNRKENESLIKFYKSIEKEIEDKKCTVYQIFNEDKKNKVERKEFTKKLISIGFDDKNEIDYIAKQFENKFDTSIINIDIIEYSLNSYKESKKREEIIKYEAEEKIKQINQLLYEKMNSNSDYLLLKVYEKIQNFMKKENKDIEYIKKWYKDSDKNNNGLLNYEDYSLCCDNIIPLSVNEKKTMFLNHKKHYMFSINNFIEKLNSFSLEEMRIFKEQYYIDNNPYLYEIKKFFKENNIVLRNIWAESLKGEITCDKEKFFALITSAMSKYSKTETDYIFDIITKGEENTINFKKFNYILTPHDEIDSLYIKTKFNKEKRNSKIDNQSNLTTSSVIDNIQKNNYSFYEIIDNNPSLYFIKNKIANANIKIKQLLNRHQQFIVYNFFYSLYHSLSESTLEKIKSEFKKEDINNTGRLPFDVINKVILNNKVSINHQNLNFLLHSLDNRTKTVFSYNEFIYKIKNIALIDQGKQKHIVNTAQLYYNDYLIELRNYVKAKNKPIENIISDSLKERYFITIEHFFSFCNSINYLCEHTEEYKYIFFLLCQYYNEAENDVDKFWIITKDNLYEFLSLTQITEKEFIRKGKMIKEEYIIKKWNKRYIKYGETIAPTFKAYYQRFVPIFEKIKHTLVTKKIKDLLHFFIKNSDESIDENGRIPSHIFVLILKLLSITSQTELQMLHDEFIDKETLCINLAQFFGAFYLFYPEKDLYFEEELEKLPNTKEVNAFYNKFISDDTVVFTNNYRSFTQKDIDTIKEICIYICEIIIKEKETTVKKYIKSFDTNRRNYITLREFKSVIEDDLEIDLESDKESMDKFFDFLCDNEKIDDEIIVRIPKVIQVLSEYSRGKEFNNVGKAILGEVLQRVIATSIKTTA